MRRAESAAKAPERSRGDVAREHVGADSRPGRAIGHHRCDERAAGPEDDAVVVPRVVDPPRLVKQADAPDPAYEAIELARVLYVGKEIEEVARVRSGESRLGMRERAAPTTREPDGAEEAAEVVGARLLAAAPIRLAVDVQRNAAPAGDGAGRAPGRVELVAAVHLGIDEADRLHEAVDEIRAPGGRAAEVRLGRIGGGVVGVRQHGAQETV